MKTIRMQKTVAAMAVMLVMCGAHVSAKPPAAAAKGLDVMETKAALLSATTNAPAASGDVRVEYQVVNGRTNQMFQLHVDGLPTNATFQVFVTMSSSTNGAAAAGAVLTNKDGEAQLKMKPNPQGKSGRGFLPLSADLSPVTQIVHVDVQDALGNSVLAANVDTTAAAFRMDAKARMGTPAGTPTKSEVKIRAHKASGDSGPAQQWSVNAKGLAKNAAVQVRIDGTIVGTGTTNRGGNFNAHGDLPNTINPALVKVIEILDAVGNVLLSTPLPN